MAENTLKLTSGSDLVRAALLGLQVIPPEGAVEPFMMQSGLQTLNLMIASWMGENNALLPGLNQWRYETVLIDLEMGQNQYRFPRGALDIVCDNQRRRRINEGEVVSTGIPVAMRSVLLVDSQGLRTALQPLTFHQYENLVTITQKQDSSAYFYHRKLNCGILHLSSIAVDLTKHLRVTYLAEVDVISEVGEELQYPSAYSNMIRLNLMKELFPLYPATTDFQIIVTLANNASIQAQMLEPVEDTDAYFRPREGFPPGSWPF
jgi:hypothetical protein